uniref:THUMP domain-containing protein n=1 Tax=Steinernema glaseri TaxID=37863 RepID=A0A1I8AR53_9BILA
MLSNYLEKIDPTTTHSARRKALVRRFVAEKLRSDGVFLLRLVASNGGDMVACELVATLWADFVAESARRADAERPLLKGPVEEEDDF